MKQSNHTKHVHVDPIKRHMLVVPTKIALWLHQYYLDSCLDETSTPISDMLQKNIYI